MFIKVLLLTTLVFCDGALYSSFWAPLFDPKILNYRVDVTFDPDGGRNDRGKYEKRFGYRGERLIADLSNGKEPSTNNKIYNDVKFYYTYGGDAEDIQ